MNDMITRAECILVPGHEPISRKPTWEVRVESSGVLLFVTTSPSALDAQLHAYSAGLMAGMDAGRAAMQQEIREALGLV